VPIFARTRYEWSPSRHRRVSRSFESPPISPASDQHPSPPRVSCFIPGPAIRRYQPFGEEIQKKGHSAIVETILYTHPLRKGPGKPQRQSIKKLTFSHRPLSKLSYAQGQSTSKAYSFLPTRVLSKLPLTGTSGPRLSFRLPASIFPTIPTSPRCTN